MKRKILGIGVLMLLLTLLLSGCFIKTVDELYTLPKHSDEYNNLQQAIDQLMAQGAAYSAPVSGVNQRGRGDRVSENRRREAAGGLYF